MQTILGQDVMNKFSFSDRRYWRNLLTGICLVAVTVLLIVWFLPRNDSFKFRYDVGRPWMYGSFIAKFDFPIYKSESTIRHERDSMLATVEPYFNFDSTVEKRNLARLHADFPDGIPGLPAGYNRALYDRLHRLYRSGIMSTPEYNNIFRDTTNELRLVKGRDAIPIHIDDVYSTMSAYESLLVDQVLSRERPLLQRCNLINYLEPNIIYDHKRTDSERNDLLSGIPLASGMVMSGQKVIDRGEIVDDYTYRVLSSYEQEMQRRNANKNEIASTVIGQVIFVSILVILFTMYLYLFRRDYIDKPRNIAMLYMLITIFPILVSLMMKHNLFSVYVIPFAMTPIFVRVFLDSRTAFITHCTMVLICAAAVKYQYEFIIVQLVSGLVAVYSLRELSKRAQLFKAALLVTLASVVTYFALQLMQDSDVLNIDYGMNYHFAVNGVLLLLAYPLMYLIEKTFGFVSNVTLFELSNTNRGLLRRLSEEAPGTFQHSITVGNLASEIASRIGADSLLVRTGALYHDIGKLVNPVFFTENQARVNPHDNMSNVDSARIIISHVTEGVKIAEENNLPQFIKDFILTHHGRRLVSYFYIKEQNEHPDQVIDKSLFTYPGPNPFTREQAILMMSDMVEAASRSLSEYTEQSINNLVDKLLDKLLAEGTFRECPITFRDVSMAKQVLKERLMAIYHTRIQYPELKKPQPTANANEAQPV